MQIPASSSTCNPVRALTLSVWLLTGLASGAMADNGAIDPVAMANASIAQLERANSISADIQVAEEAVLSNGLKIKSLREGSLTLQRGKPAVGFVFTRKGALVDQVMSYDGERLYMLGNKTKAAVSVPASGTIDQLMDNMVEAGAYLPGRDLLYTDAAQGLLEDVLESAYGGLVPVNGESCHYLSFRGPDVDWHLWVNAETQLPCKYMITSKWMTAAPEFEMDFSNWQLDVPVAASTFRISMPEDYVQASSFEALQPTYE
ncbi:MAG: DUF2092 domain-containing protein [Halioglobus sp.]|nr:DUF2092 domain-containing protein [Halioglobus sp.]